MLSELGVGDCGLPGAVETDSQPEDESHRLFSFALEHLVGSARGGLTNHDTGTLAGEFCNVRAASGALPCRYFRTLALVHRRSLHLKASL